MGEVGCCYDGLAYCGCIVVTSFKNSLIAGSVDYIMVHGGVDW